MPRWTHSTWINSHNMALITAAEARAITRKPAIYKITAPSGNFYVGSSIYARRRWNKHRSDLRCNRHHSPALQASANKYGCDALDFEILEFCSREELMDREQFYIDTLNPRYNVGLVAGRAMLGRKHSKESAKKIGDANRGNRHTEDSRRRMSIAHAGKVLSGEHRKNLSHAHNGRPQSDEHKKKRADAQRGKRHTEGTIEKIRLAKRKYSDKQYQEMLSSYESGVKISDLAKLYGVHENTMSLYIRAARMLI
jgi:group I intron endonuclease